MAWANYTNFRLVVLKNGVEIERGEYTGFAVTNKVLTRIVNDINTSGGNLSSIAGAYRADASAYSTADYWDFFVGGAGLTSSILKSAGIDEQLTAVNDVLTYYNPNVGPRYAIHLKCTGVYGDIKYMKVGYTVAGTTTWDTNELQFSGTYGGYLYSIVIGVLRQDFGAYPFFIIGNTAVSTGRVSRCDLFPWFQIARSTFISTMQYNYFFVFSDEWQPPTPPTPSTDPYADGGYSTGTDTGTGTFDDTSESVPLPTTYAFSATAAGIMSQYVLTEANLAAFGSWLWNGGSIIDDLKHFFQSPMEAIFSVGILPFTPSDTTQYNVYVGALAATGVQGGHVNDTVEKISCGSIDFDGYYGGSLDYNPYTKIELFLPYCGTLTLNPDEVMGHTISVDYYCDTITGDCVAFVSDEERVLHQVRGNCFIQIPLAARDFTALYSSAIAAIGTIAAGLATAASGGLSAPVAVGMGTSMAANAMNAKTHIARAGGVSGMAGFMSIQKPYVIMTIPNQCLPEFQNDFQGYPLFVTKRLGDFSGFTKVYEIHLDGLDCTDAEMKEIYELLKGGVVL